MIPNQLNAVLAWALLVPALVILGSAAFANWFAPAPEADAPYPLEAVGRVWFWLAVANLVASPLAMVVTIATMADESIRDSIAYAPLVMRDTTFGHLWAIRIPVAIALLGVASIRGQSRVKTTTIFALSAALMLLQSLASHAIDKGALDVAVYFTHLAAAGMWSGALVSLLVCATHRTSGSAWIERAAPRVSRIAAWSVATIAATGTFTALRSIGWDVRLLYYSLYGRTLLWKLATAATVVLIGGYNRYRVMPAMGESRARAALVRNVSVECMLIGAVIAWSAVLANTPPPH